jgi:hypothetical protein
MLGDLIRRFFSAGPGGSDILPQTIDRLVAATDSRLSLLPGYRKVLAPGMRTSLAYVQSLSQKLPDSLDLSLLSFTLDRRLGLFFSSPSSLLSLLKKNQPLHEFFLAASNGPDAYALLMMQRTDSLRYGMAQQDGELRADVAQTVVSFDQHRLILPCPSMAALRQRSPERGLDVLTRVIARRLALLDRERLALDCELTRISLRLSALSHPQRVLIDAMPVDDSLPKGREALLARQQVLTQRLGEVKSVTELSGLLELVAHMLEHPEDYLRLELSVLNLDRMGVVQREEAGSDATQLCVEDMLMGPDEPVQRVELPVHVSLDAIAELERCVTDAD